MPYFAIMFSHTHSKLFVGMLLFHPSKTARGRFNCPWLFYRLIFSKYTSGFFKIFLGNDHPPISVTANPQNIQSRFLASPCSAGFRKSRKTPDYRFHLRSQQGKESSLPPLLLAPPQAWIPEHVGFPMPAVCIA